LLRSLNSWTYQKVFLVFDPQSATELRDEDSFLTQGLEGLASDVEYKAFWKKMAVCDIDPDKSSKRLWLRVQDALNEELSELFVVGVRNAIENPIITIDDDKMHYAMGSKTQRTDGLKRSQHVRDNRHGFVCNHVVYTASGILIGLDFERSGDSDSTSSSLRVIKNQIDPQHGDSPEANLTGWHICGDRGYWKNRFEEFVLRSGMDIEAGTHKRDSTFPFTYDQKPSKNDVRRHLDTKGEKVCIMIRIRLLLC
jgi:hypothetical protein